MKQNLAVFCGLLFGLTCLVPGYSGAVLIACFGLYDDVIMMLMFRKNGSAASKYPDDDKTPLVSFLVSLSVGLAVSFFLLLPILSSNPIVIHFLLGGLSFGTVPFFFRKSNPDMKFRFSSLVGTFFLFAALSALVIVSGNNSQPYAIAQWRSPDNPSVTVVKIMNTTRQTVEEWYIEFPEGEVDACGGATLLYRERSVTKRLTDSSQEEHKPNTFTGNDSTKTISPGMSVTFTYISKMGTHLKLNTRLMYRTDAGAVLMFTTAAFISGAALIVPGVSSSAIFRMFGVEATLESALSNMSIGLIIPGVIAALCGFLLAARIVRYALTNSPIRFYTVMMGLLGGSGVAVAFEGLSENYSLMAETIFAGAALVVGGAIACAIGMEKSGRDELRQLSENLIK